MKRDPLAKSTFLGADVAAFRDSGALLIPRRDGFLAQVVRNDGTAARRGLRSGDRIEGMASAEAIAKKLREGRELTVVRDVNGVGVDTTLAAEGAPVPVSGRQ
jgi:hypothetical protein